MNLLCLHGFTGSPGVWEPILKELDGVTAWCPPLLGHDGEKGNSLKTATSFEDEVGRLVSGLKARTEEPCILLGYSMGARVGLGMLLSDPSLFTAAFLVGVHPGFRRAGLTEENARRRRAEQDEALARRLEHDGLEAFIDHWQEIALFASQKRLSEEVLARQRKGRLGQRADGLAAALRTLGLAQMPEYGRGLQSLHMPVKLMVGEEDTKFLHLARDMVKDLPRGEILSVPGVGHNVVLEAPGAVAQAVVAALEDSFDD